MKKLNTIRIRINTTKNILPKIRDNSISKFRSNSISINTNNLRKSKANIINIIEKEDEKTDDIYNMNIYDSFQDQKGNKKMKYKSCNDNNKVDNKCKNYYEYLKVKYNCKEIIYNINNINNSLKEIDLLENKNKKLYLEEKYTEQKWFLNYKSITEDFYKNIRKEFKNLFNKEKNCINEKKKKKESISEDTTIKTNYNNGKKRKRK